MSDNQIAIPVPQECWQRVYDGGPRPEQSNRVLLECKERSGPRRIAGWWDAETGEWYNDKRQMVRSNCVLAYLDPGPYIPPPPPVEVGQVRVSPTGVRAKIVNVNDGDGCCVHIDMGNLVIHDWVVKSKVAEWPIAEGTE